MKQSWTELRRPVPTSTPVPRPSQTTMASSEMYDEGVLRGRNSPEDFELQEEEDDYGEHQDERLLPADGSKPSKNVEYRSTWHLRTHWVIVLSVIILGSVYAFLLWFAQHYIVSGAKLEDVEMTGIGGFRRPASDYILDPSWNFNDKPRVREYKWTIVDIVANPDGIFRPMLSVNGLFPGPMVRANEGDTLVIEVDNQSVNATAIHFHGIFQNGTNHMDGTSGVTVSRVSLKDLFDKAYVLLFVHVMDILASYYETELTLKTAMSDCTWAEIQI